MANHLTDADVRWALKHLQQFGDTDLFPRPFELDLLVEKEGVVVKHVQSIDLRQHVWSRPRRALVLKDELSFRSATQLDPLDAVIFAAIIRHDAKAMEKRRGARKGRVFSYPIALKANGQLYGTNGYEDFWKESGRLAQSAEFVLVTDISDFYNQVYHHTLEQEFQASNMDQAGAGAIVNLLKLCSSTTSRGLPIGPHGTHLLAELSLRQVDEALRNAGFTYVRYVDDIHVFCMSKSDGYRALHLLAQVLDLVKLQLNRSKTKLVAAADWREVAKNALDDDPVNDDERALIDGLRAAAPNNPYAVVRRTRMPPALRSALDRLRVIGIVKTYLSATPVDFPRLRWFFRRLTQTTTAAAVDIVVERFEELTPAAADTIRYLRYALSSYSGDKPHLGEQLLKVLDHSAVKHSEYLRLIVLSLFAGVADLNHVAKLMALFPTIDAAAQREVVLAATNAKADGWLRTLKPMSIQDPWVRRAVVFSSATWTADERKHWIKSVKGYGFLTDLVVEAVSQKDPAKKVMRILGQRPKRL
ncbi:MAG: RNA-directed DNA polymerase [Labilithrix sp.]|nr:RNA-directed DNA polymerase [Labilithrix sp.]